MKRLHLTCTARGARQSRSGCQQCHHDTKTLPPGGFYFAPGAIEHGPRRKARRLTGWQRLVRGCALLLALLALVGYVALMLQAKGWPL